MRTIGIVQSCQTKSFKYINRPYVEEDTLTKLKFLTIKAIIHIKQSRFLIIGRMEVDARLGHFAVECGCQSAGKGSYCLARDCLIKGQILQAASLKISALAAASSGIIALSGCH